MLSTTLSCNAADYCNALSAALTNFLTMATLQPLKDVLFPKLAFSLLITPFKRYLAIFHLFFEPPLLKMLICHVYMFLSLNEFGILSFITCMLTLASEPLGHTANKLYIFRTQI